MARKPRITVVGQPHHVIQRGNRRQRVFFSDEDKRTYLGILKLQAKLFQLQIWAYCLMDNHVHLIAVPMAEESLIRAIGETHQLYTRMINFREGWRGYLWQGRFKSAPMDAKYVYAAVRYVERNPVRAGLVQKAEQYLWSSAQAHVQGVESHDALLTRFYLMDEIEDWSEYLSQEEDENKIQVIRQDSERGRLLGDSRVSPEICRGG